MLGGKISLNKFSSNFIKFGCIRDVLYRRGETSNAARSSNRTVSKSNDASNYTMLSSIGQSPLSTLEGTKSYDTITAEGILDKECKRILLEGWEFNTEDDYELKPDNNKIIHITEDMLMVKIPEIYQNRYVVRKNKLYDKINHSYEIDKSLNCKVVWNFNFEEMPENFRHYCAISSAYKFCKRVLGSESASIYTKEDVVEAYRDLQGYELETGNYSLIPEMFNRVIRGDI